MVRWPQWRVVQACNRNGVRYCYSVPVPRLADEYLDTSIYFYGSEADAMSGSHTGGSGFLALVSFESWPKYKRGFAYAVTNRHVIEGGATVLRFNKGDGGAEAFPTVKDSWIFHPDGDDLAICQLGIDSEIVRFRTVGLHQMVSQDTMAKYNIGVGEDAFFVGRFIGHDGRQVNTPAMRFGNVAMAPAPIRQSNGLNQESWLVETKSWPGVSGSPVFVMDNPAYPRPGEKADRPQPQLHRWGPLLLGVVWCYLPTMPQKTTVYERDDDGNLDERENVWVKHHSGMAGVVPAWKLLDMLNREDLVKMRKEHEAAWIAEQEQQVMGEPLMESGGFTRDQFFRDLTKVTRRVEPESDQESDEK